MPGDKPSLVATGGFEKQLRIFDLGKTSSGDPLSPESATAPPKPAAPSYEIGAGVHQAAIKSIIWGPDRNVLISAADDKVVRWWDIRTHSQPIKTFTLEGPLGSCEMNTLTNPIGSSRSTISVAAGKSAYFFSSTKPADLEAVHKTQHEIASVAVNTMDEKFVTGGSGDTWVRVYDFQTGKELNIYKGHHGPVWSTAFSPDGKICATGSEDGTIKLWKFANDAYGLWR
jgi:serine-threonine kinase receptor-associated protein